MFCEIRDCTKVLSSFIFSAFSRSLAIALFTLWKMMLISYKYYWEGDNIKRHLWKMMFLICSLSSWFVWCSVR